MDLKNCEAYVIPFSVQENSAWKSVIQYLSKRETTPVEAICNSRIVSVDKEYYPVEHLELTYEAKWNAISVFKEYWTEEETHYEQQVHYFDRLGKEHERPGFDYFDVKSGKWKNGAYNPITSTLKGYSGNANARPWKPVEVTVAVTEKIPYERETGRKRNSGNVTGKHIYQHTKGYTFFYDLFSDSGKIEKVPYAAEYIKSEKVMTQPEPFGESDYNSVYSAAKSNARDQCIKKIPGQAYADFHMNIECDDVIQVWYYPVYHIIYEFNKQEYECLASGCQEGSVYGKTAPEDGSIESAKQEYEKQNSELKARKKKCWLKFAKIWLGMFVFGVFSMSLIPLVAVIGSAGNIIGSILNMALWGVVIYLCWTNYKDIKNIKKEIKENEEAKNNIIPIRQKKKQAIMDVVINDNLNDIEKAEKCKEIINC